MVAYSMFASAVGAMHAQSRAFQNIGDNVSNSQTNGYKAGQIRFQEMVGGKNAGSTFNSLIGTQANQYVYRDKEGVVVGSTRQLDAALSGSGFFITSTALAQTDDTLELTDAGSFSETLTLNGTDEEVYLTDIKGNFLLGWAFDPVAGTFDIDTSSTDSLIPIRVDPSGNLFGAIATTNAGLTINLPSTAVTGDTHTFDIPIFDGTGDDDGVADGRQVITTFVKTATPDVWDLTVSGTGGTVTTPAVQPVQVTFDANGVLALVDGATDGQLPITIDWTGPAVSNTLNIDFRGSTQFSDVAIKVNLSVNGNTDGVLTDVTLRGKGEVVGIFSNGLDRPLARIALADVVEPNRLLEAGLTHYKLGPNSGEIQLFDLENTNRATFSGQATEISTTDLAQEFTNMIVTQRAYSSAATSLKTIDEMVRTATELK